MVDETAEEASSRLTKSGLMISVKKSYGQHAWKPMPLDGQRKRILKQWILNSYVRTVVEASHQRLHCKRSKWNCPDISSFLAFPKHEDQGRYDWHFCEVVRVNNRAEMWVTVEYYDGEPREGLTLQEEERRIISYPEKRIAPSREGSAADWLVKSVKNKAAQDNLNHAKRGDEELSNTLQCKYLGVMQAADRDPLSAVFHGVEIAWSRFRNLKYILTESKVSKVSYYVCSKPQWYQFCYTFVSLGKWRRRWNANLTVLHLKCSRLSRADPSRKKPELLLLTKVMKARNRR